MRIVDSTRYGTYFNCPRERYWSHEYMGRGITPTAPSMDLLYGSAVHKGCEELARGARFDEALFKAGAELAPLSNELTPEKLPRKDELGALLFGHLRCYQEFIFPKLQEEYEILGVEQEIIIPLSSLPPIYYCTRLDKILQRREDGLFFNLNYKTSSYLNDIFLSMERSVQLMMEAEAARIHLKEKGKDAFITGTIVIGFDKGQKRKVSEGEKKRGLEGRRVLSPLTYGYVKEDNPWNAESLYSPVYKSGWRRFPIWNEIGIESWWEMLPEEMKRMQFSILPPIHHHPEMIKDIKEQILETEIRIAADAPMNRVFPMNTHNCNQHAGFIHHTCPYTPLCWGDEDPMDLIGGMYEWRPINHPKEDELVPHYEWEEGVIR